MKKLWSIFLYSTAVSTLAGTPLAFADVFKCQSDATVAVTHKQGIDVYPEYIAEVTPQQDRSMSAHFLARKNYVKNNQIYTRILIKQTSSVHNTSTHLTVFGREWNLAISPNLNRASLYSNNPYLNEVPMFCLSRD